MTDFAHKVIFLTDIHITKPGRTIIGLDPTERLRACLSHAAENHPDASALVVMGDLTHHGVRQEYEQLQTSLTDLPWPVHLMLGNHDLRVKYLESFPNAPTDPNGFVQQVIEVGDHFLILLDSHDSQTLPFHGGHYCDDRLDWLRDQLEGKPAGSCILAIHHPPFQTGFPGMDLIGLENRDALNQLIAESDAVAMTLAGHIHRTMWGVAGGKPCAVLKSSCHQAPIDLVSENSSLSIDEPGAYGLLILGEGGAVLLNEDVGLPQAEIVDDPASR